MFTGPHKHYFCSKIFPRKNDFLLLLFCLFFSPFVFALPSPPAASVLLPKTFTIPQDSTTGSCSTNIQSNGATSATPMQMSLPNGGLNYYPVRFSGYYLYTASCTWYTDGPASALPIYLWVDAWATSNVNSVYPVPATPAQLDVRMLYSGEAPLQLQKVDTVGDPDSAYKFVLHGGAFLNRGAQIYLPRVWTDANNTASSWTVTCDYTITMMSKS